jgi:superfamily II DNA helicase RecQ
VPVTALTATATDACREDVIRVLRMGSPQVFQVHLLCHTLFSKVPRALQPRYAVECLNSILSFQVKQAAIRECTLLSLAARTSD